MANGFHVTVRDVNNNPLRGIIVWLSYESDNPHAYATMICQSSIDLVGWPYQVAYSDANGVATFHPTFAGSGPLAIQYEYNCGPGYFDIGSAIGSGSTDLDGDSDTDENDKTIIRQALETGSGYYDLNQDGHFDVLDYNVVRDEYLRMTSGVGFCDGTPPGPYVEDTTPPDSILDLQVVATTCTTAELSWTAPGDDHHTGTAESFDLRMSNSPINDLNFNSATQLTAPTPGPYGTLEDVTITVGTCAHKYFAVKTKDHSHIGNAGNWSGMSNTVLATTPCGYCDDGLSARRTEVTTLRLSAPMPNPAATRVRLAAEIPPALGEAPFELKVLDVAGRVVREIAQGTTHAGTFATDWDLRGESGARVPNGIYFVRMTVGSTVLSTNLFVRH